MPPTEDAASTPQDNTAHADRTTPCFPCPCCGHLVLESFGSWDICPICFWEDDLTQMRWPTMPSGANSTSLVQAQRNYRAFGACDENGRQHCRQPRLDEFIDPQWRPIDLLRDSFEHGNAPEPWPDDYSVLCWWLPTFWRRDVPLPKL
ncbi:CPCC family cysteine-rich protein [Streptacidiphilus sp. P02-A3a]|uniref:CPCC family cysteine-rich protein n=1 Tax=Streptacidiphilus sp. P02-A3a TaxID=2704468 RepID=UPI0015FBC339|nr:CPCC family cysteine-rich protein [Streptacidiphilus sp. P02-A3a]QMU70167.1 hypothetical protein GXP74_19965 [Streptacidiphilus sp. P02-A3a]QMU70383.1 hypothetical protein GXP74_21390 [Streptacidiphilus sp. P02-A3a]